MKRLFYQRRINDQIASCKQQFLHLYSSMDYEDYQELEPVTVNEYELRVYQFGLKLTIVATTQLNFPMRKLKQ